MQEECWLWKPESGCSCFIAHNCDGDEGEDVLSKMTRIWRHFCPASDTVLEDEKVLILMGQLRKAFW